MKQPILGLLLAVLCSYHLKAQDGPGEIIFVNADTSNVYPREAISVNSANGDNLWQFRPSANGTSDGDYVESYMSLGDDSPDISMIVEDVLDTGSTYNVYLYYTDPASQPWHIGAKLPDETDYIEYSLDTPGAVNADEQDGDNDRLFRVLLGEVTGTTDVQVDLMDNFDPLSVFRSVFDGIGYQFLKVNAVPLSLTKKTDLTIYPNPTSEVVKVPIPFAESVEGTISVLDISGKLIKSQPFSKGSNQEEVFLPREVGIYWIRVSVPSLKWEEKYRVIKK